LSCRAAPPQPQSAVSVSHESSGPATTAASPLLSLSGGGAHRTRSAGARAGRSTSAAPHHIRPQRCGRCLPGCVSRGPAGRCTQRLTSGDGPSLWLGGQRNRTRRRLWRSPPDRTSNDSKLFYYRSAANQPPDHGDCGVAPSCGVSQTGPTSLSGVGPRTLRHARRSLSGVGGAHRAASAGGRAGRSLTVRRWALRARRCRTRLLICSVP